ncbi:MAG TPA: DivIVA domain-containing protein [Gemmatimonadales bacterium]|nr:DivIVA domain-containing protein [Gemmatimonadales bacterium]
MSDAAFRLSPHDIRSQQFGRVFRGLAPGEVDEFVRRVADELEGALRDKVQMEERLRGAQEQLKVFRERERAMNEALVAAQQLREEARTAADHGRDAVLKDAQRDAERLLEEARRTEQGINERIEQAERQFAGYIAALRALVARQLAEIDVLETQARG